MRRTETVTIPGVRTETLGQRDNGKTFILTEMPADQGERWANRVIFAIGAAGIDLPEAVPASGMAGLASVGIQSLLKVPYTIAEPLLDEMFQQVQFQLNPRAPMQNIFSGDESQIEEVPTRWKLRLALWKLHTGLGPKGDTTTSVSPPSEQKAA